MPAELLHAGALGAAGLGTCCVALDRPRLRIRELMLSVVMFVAMLDVVAGFHLVPVVAWSGVTIVLAMALGIRRRRSIEPAAVVRMRVHSAVGAILMAALMLVMSGGPVAATASHHGSMNAGALSAGLAAGTVAFAAWSATRLRRGHLVDRLQYASMAISLLLLAGAAVG